MSSTGKVVGYARVSSADQNPERQTLAITEFIKREYGREPDRMYVDKVSGKSTSRPQLAAMRDFVREDDVVVIHSPDRLARSTADLLSLMQEWTDKEVTVRFVTQPMLDQKDAAGRMMLGILGVIAEFERALTRERQREGIEAAKKRGVYAATRKITPQQAAEIRDKAAQGVSRKFMAETYGVSVDTIYNVIKRRGVYALPEYAADQAQPAAQ